MKKLDKKTQKLWAEHVGTLEEREKELDAAFEDYQTAVAGYNEAIREAEDLRQTIENEIEHYIDTRSAKWQDGTRGDRYRQWLADWRDAALQEIDEPAEPFGAQDTMALTLVELPDEVDLTCLDD